MYSKKLVCSVKVNGKILREKHEDGNAYVYLPFGSEYELALKNLSGQNSVVNIEIDGKNVVRGGLYLNAGKSVDLERFVESLDKGRRFKFIQKTQEIADHRGDRLDDGIIRVTWQFEKVLPEVKIVEEHVYRKHHHHCHCYIRWCHICQSYHRTCEPCNPWRGIIWRGPSWTASTSPWTSSGSNVTLTSSIGSQGKGQSIGSVYNVQHSEVNANEGITVAGSESKQKFQSVSAGVLEENTHSMIILLRGYQDNNIKVVQKPFTVKEKLTCPTCGRKWKSNFEFCGNCGTALVS